MLVPILAPLALAAVAYAVPSNRHRPLALLAGAAVHAAAVAALWREPIAPAPGRWLAFDAPARVALATGTLLFSACAVYAQGYLARRADKDNRLFVGGLLVLQSSVTVVALTQHLGVLWVALELTTLSTAPLLYFEKSARSLEAAWKYLLVCSLGIALALLGTFFLALSGAAPGGPRSLLVGDLVAAGPLLSTPWVRAGFVFLLVGYGTKMGLAPLHSWKPDAYGEAPGLLGALLSGGLTTFAFLAVARVLHVAAAAGDGAFARGVLVAMGLLSMAVAAVFMLAQRDFKRMLAWSSVEHVGILALGIGLGGAAAGGAFFHAVNNGLTKGVLFLAAGNLHRAYGSKRVEDVRGATRRVPISAALFLLGFLAITGTPPFGPFFSELAIVGSAFADGRFAVGGLFLAFAAIIYVGMGSTVLKITQGAPPEGEPPPGPHEGALTAAPPIVLLVAVVLLGVALPEDAAHLFALAARQVGAAP